MKQETFEIIAASLEEAKSQAKTKIPQGCFVLSETVLSDGSTVTIRESAESIEAALEAARSKVPGGFRVEHEKEVRRPERKIIRVAADGEEGARSQAQSQLDKNSVIKKVMLVIPGTKGFLGIRKAQNQYDIEILSHAEVEIKCASDAKLSVTICRTEESVKDKAVVFVRKALDIINRQVVLSPFFQVKGTGDTGPLMEAVNLLRQALTIESDVASLHYAYVCALNLASQFKTADEENTKLIELYPDYALARFSSEAWSSGAIISPSPFAYPEWTTTSATLPMFYKGKLSTFIIFPAREGIYPRAVLFEKDSEGWWTIEKLRGIKAEIAVVLVPGNLNVAAIYRRCTGPGLTKADMQEALVILDLPKDDISLVGWEYLVDAVFTDVVIVDRNDNVILNQRVPLSTETKATLVRICGILLNTRGRKISNQEELSALQKYQSGADLEEIERKYFRRTECL